MRHPSKAGEVVTATDLTPEERQRRIDAQDQANWEASLDAEFEREKQWEDEQRWIDWDNE